MCVSLQRRAIPHFKTQVLLQRRAPKCMNPAHDVRGNPRHAKISILPQFPTSDQHEVTRGFTVEVTNLHFTTVLDVRWARNDERVARRPRPIRISPQFWTSEEHETTRGLRPRVTKFAFHHSFGRPTTTKWREGCDGDVQNSHFTSVLDVRWARNDERVARRSQKFAFHHSFGRPTSTKWREGGLPSWSTKPTLRKKKEILKKSWSTTILSRSSQQIFSADPQQIFSADLLSRFSQQIFSADFLSRSSHSRSSQQIFSADLLQQIFSADLLSRSSHQIFSAVLLSRSSQQIFSANLLSYHVAVVRGWWSAITAILSRSSQPSCCCGQGLVVSFWWSAIVLSFAVVRGWWSAIVLSFLSFAVVRGWWSAIVLSFAVVRGWWSAIVLSCWWSILHEFFRRTLSRSFREKNPLKRDNKRRSCFQVSLVWGNSLWQFSKTMVFLCRADWWIMVIFSSTQLFSLGKMAFEQL